MTDLNKVLGISTSGMEAQGARLKIIAENLANADSAAPVAGGNPYRRKLVTFKDQLDRATGNNMVKVDRVIPDKTDFIQKYEPGHPSANAQGYVSMPNVNPLIEAMDMREAERSYSANVDALTITKSMLSKTIGLLQN